LQFNLLYLIITKENYKLYAHIILRDLKNRKKNTAINTTIELKIYIYRLTFPEKYVIISKNGSNAEIIFSIFLYLYLKENYCCYEINIDMKAIPSLFIGSCN
jgi:hypothetical protein